MTDKNRPATQSAWFVVGVLWIANIFNYADRMAMPVLLPAIKEEMALSDGQLGLLVGLAFSLFYAFCSMPVALFADRGVRKNVIAGAVIVWSGMTALTGLAQNYWHLVLARMGVGAGEAGCIAPSQSLICDYVAPEKRSGVLAFHMTGNYIGIILSMTIAGWLAVAVGWRWTLIALGLPGILVGVILFFTVREPQRGALDASRVAVPRPSLGRTLAMLAGNRTYCVIVVWYVLNGFMQYGTNQWLPSFYARVHHMSVGDVGFPLGMAIGAGAAAGLLAGGMAGNRLGSRGMDKSLMLGAVATALSLAAMVGTLTASTPGWSLAAVAVTNVLWAISTGPVLATIFNTTAPQIRSFAAALPIFLTAIFGFGLGPVSVGLLSDQLAPAFGGDALKYAMLLPVVPVPAMAALLFWAARLKARLPPSS